MTKLLNKKLHPTTKIILIWIFLWLFSTFLGIKYIVYGAVIPCKDIWYKITSWAQWTIVLQQYGTQCQQQYPEDLPQTKTKFWTGIWILWYSGDLAIFVPVWSTWERISFKTRWECNVPKLNLSWTCINGNYEAEAGVEVPQQ